MEKRKKIAIVWIVVLVIGLLVGNFFLLDEVDSDESLCLVKGIDSENENLAGVTVSAYSDSGMEDPVSDKEVTDRNGEALLRIKRSRGENNPVRVSIEKYGFYSEVREVRDLRERQPRDSEALVVGMWRAGSIGVNLSEKHTSSGVEFSPQEGRIFIKRISTEHSRIGLEVCPGEENTSLIRNLRIRLDCVDPKDFAVRVGAIRNVGFTGYWEANSYLIDFFGEIKDEFRIYIRIDAWRADDAKIEFDDMWGAEVSRPDGVADKVRVDIEFV